MLPPMSLALQQNGWTLKKIEISRKCKVVGVLRMLIDTTLQSFNAIDEDWLCFTSIHKFDLKKKLLDLDCHRLVRCHCTICWPPN